MGDNSQKRAHRELQRITWRETRGPRAGCRTSSAAPIIYVLQGLPTRGLPRVMAFSTAVLADAGDGAHMLAEREARPAFSSVSGFGLRVEAFLPGATGGVGDASREASAARVHIARRQRLPARCNGGDGAHVLPARPRRPASSSTTNATTAAS